MNKKKYYAVILLIIIIFIAYKIFLKPYQVSSNGMAPSILKQEKFIVDKLVFKNPDDLNYGDIIVYKYKDKDVRIWRLIGKAGDEISIINGVPIVNDEEAIIHEIPCPKVDELAGYKCYEETLFDKTYQIAFNPEQKDNQMKHGLNIEKFEVPPNSLFLLGDCRDCSFDCRFTGFVENKQIIGKALFFYQGRVHDLGDSM